MRSISIILLTVALGAGCTSEPRRTYDMAAAVAELTVVQGGRERHELGMKFKQLLLDGQFWELDGMADELRASHARFPDGTSELRAFYAEGCRMPDGVDEAMWLSFLKQLHAWCDSNPASITAPVALANGLFEYAWHARGTGYANTVTDQASRLMAERLDQARAVLEGARSLPERCPGWWAADMRVALADRRSREQYEATYREAVERNPGFEAYDELKARYLLPRWHGQKGDWERFGQEVVQRLPDPDGFVAYARMVWAQHEYYENVFQESEASWLHTQRGMTELLRRSPDSEEVLGRFCRLAVLAGDRDQAAFLFKRLGSRVDLEIWGTSETFVEARVWALGSPA